MESRRCPALDPAAGLALAYLSLVLVAAAAYVTIVDSSLGKGVLLVAIALSSALAVVAGIVRNAPARRDLWYAVAVALVVAAAGAGAWYAQLLAQGAPPTALRAR